MSFLLMILLSAMVQYFLPWWSVALVPFGISAWKGTSGKGAFFNGFFSAGLLWLGLAWYEHQRSGGILTERISTLFQGAGTPALLAATALIGALVGGFASMSGYFVRQLISPKTLSEAEKAKAYW
ncbi:MAG: hypothetical protein J7576_05615 [Siphonobacter aquaeclarae]|nr:hypothetical protein [Siphonobacter aquaeclarae]